MKRSDAIKIIVDNIVLTSIYAEDGIMTYEEGAEILLKRLEEEGMTPPTRYTTTEHGMSVKARKWEDEE